MRHQLYIVEGLPCSGKSTLSAYLASVLKLHHDKVLFVDEGTGEHPADYEYHALAPAGLLSSEREVVSLSQYSGEMLNELLKYKIYDALPWETEMPLMLDKWRQFVKNSNDDTIYVFNGVLLQNPMCETMMRFGFDEWGSRQYIREIEEIIRPMNPAIIYLKNDDIASSVLKTSEQRPGWLDAVIDYHVNGTFGRQSGAVGFGGYVRCLKERQNRELRILHDLPLRRIVVEQPQRDWDAAKAKIFSFAEAVWACEMQ